ncbi:hypothetical protein [Streptomyces sp. NPDC058657]|uniref:hypothetical protein n=1 Tax=unclassified Streptomyces TaxID=2593676 RepID=UPI003669A9C0
MSTAKRLALLGALWGIGLLAAGLIPYVWTHEPGKRVPWLLLAVLTLLGACLYTFVEMRVRRLSARAASGHVYLSTGCFHGEHAYCQSMTGQQGEKRPGRCKFCEARCTCSCHVGEVPA